MAHIITVFWRDIPAQVIAEEGRGRNRKQAKVELEKRFLIAIDSAAMKSGADNTDDYLNDWRRSKPETISVSLEFEADKLRQKLEKKYSNAELKLLISNDGYKPL